MLSFYRDNWHNVGAVLFAGLAFFMGFWGSVFTPPQCLLVFSFMALLAHQYEEYGMPGGGGLVINAVMYGERRDYARFPGNKQTMMVTNTLAAYPFYIAAIVFPHAFWLGLAACFFGFSQVIGHGVLMNWRARTLYNPGLATTLVFLVPMGVAYIRYVEANALVSGMDYFCGALGFLAAAALILGVPIRTFMDRNSPYPMTAEEMGRFHILEKLKAKGLVDG